jgi:hypothetical protein
MLRSIVGICCAGAALTACKAAAPVPYESSLQGDVPAVIVNPTAESRAELQQAVSQMLSGVDVLLAAEALTKSSTLTIERKRSGSLENPPLSGRDLGTPERFHLLLTGTGCVLVHESDQSTVPLKQTDCAPEE